MGKLWRGCGGAAMSQQDARDLERAIDRVDSWLDTLWSPSGYGGPIAHWWESNLLFTAPLYDWRYEGIIDGYRTLFVKTGKIDYLSKATRAADVAANALLQDGRYDNSSFQFGPVAGGTPHEAAMDSALFGLATALESSDPKRAQRYREAAMKNIECYWVRRLWNGQGFIDQPGVPTLVANKHGTVLEALVGAGLVDGPWETYVRACVDVILSSQILEGPQAGGTRHRGIGPSGLAVPIYTARAMNGLLSLYECHPSSAIREAVLRSVPFFNRTIGTHGVIWGIYGDGRIARYPEITAGAGDVLRFLWRVETLGWDNSGHESLVKLQRLLLDAQLPSGGFPTGYGFAAKGLDRRPRRGDIRDILPVAGWVDKVFRALALLLEGDFTARPSFMAEPYTLQSFWKGQRVTWQESPTSMSITRGTHLLYHWEKGNWAPTTYAL